MSALNGVLNTGMSTITYIAMTAMNAKCPVQRLKTHRVAEISIPDNTVRATLNKLAVMIIHVMDGWDAFNNRVFRYFVRMDMKNNMRNRFRAARKNKLNRAADAIVRATDGGWSDGLTFPSVPYTISVHFPVILDCSVLSPLHSANPDSVVQVPTRPNENDPKVPLPGWKLRTLNLTPEILSPTP